jgi:hypothetical protein
MKAWKTWNFTDFGTGMFLKILSCFDEMVLKMLFLQKGLIFI